MIWKNRTGMSTGVYQPSKAGGELCATIGSVGQEVAKNQTFTRNHHGRVALSCPFHGAAMNHNLIVE